MLLFVGGGLSTGYRPTQLSSTRVIPNNTWIGGINDSHNYTGVPPIHDLPKDIAAPFAYPDGGRTYHGFTYYDYPIHTGFIARELDPRSWWVSGQVSDGYTKLLQSNQWVSGYRKYTLPASFTDLPAAGPTYTAETSTHTVRRLRSGFLRDDDDRYDEYTVLTGNTITIPNNTKNARINSSAWKASDAGTRLDNGWKSIRNGGVSEENHNDINVKQALIKTNGSNIDFIIDKPWVVGRWSFYDHSNDAGGDAWFELLYNIVLQGNNNSLRVVIDNQVTMGAGYGHGFDRILRFINVEGTGNKVYVHFTERGRLRAEVFIYEKGNNVNLAHVIGYRPGNHVSVSNHEGKLSSVGVRAFKLFYKIGPRDIYSNGGGNDGKTTSNFDRYRYAD